MFQKSRRHLKILCTIMVIRSNCHTDNTQTLGDILCNIFARATWRPWFVHPWYIYIYTWCDNLIPGMALWKQNLVACALAAAVTFRILPLWRYALRERRCHCCKLSRQSFSGIPRSNSSTLRWMSESSANLCPFRAFF
jgi:hypothetical protein